MIPITSVRCGPEEEALVLEVLRSGMLAQGPMVERFEQCCREMAGTRHAIAVSNGTTALSAALEALDLEPGDEVVTSPFTFVATLNSILESGATARFADISEIDFNMSPAHVESVLTERTRVLMPVHLYGQTADMGPIQGLAEAHGCRVVEDAAQAHGASYEGRPAGSFGIAIFSFYATKNLMSGEGGVVTTDDDDVAERVRVLRNQGMRARYDYERPGHNYRLTDLAAAVAIPQFARLDAICEARSANARYYSERLAGIEGLVVPSVQAGRRHVWHQYTLRVTDTARRTRDQVLASLQSRGIGSGVYYPRPVHHYDCFRGHPRVHQDDDTSTAERVAGEVLSIPVHQHLTADELAQVADAVVAALQ